MSTHLTLDPIACEGHGICAELLPEHITLDDWGTRSSTAPLSPSSTSRTRDELSSTARHWPCACGKSLLSKTARKAGKYRLRNFMC
jgi:ferredoxin